MKSNFPLERRCEANKTTWVISVCDLMLDFYMSHLMYLRQMGHICEANKTTWVISVRNLMLNWTKENLIWCLSWFRYDWKNWKMLQLQVSTETYEFDGIKPISHIPTLYVSSLLHLSDRLKICKFLLPKRGGNKNK